MRNISISVVLPAYNEEENIRKSVETIFGFLKEEFGDFELIVVDDGSDDRTYEILVSLKETLGNRLRLIRHQRNRGYGAALRSGLFSAQKDLVFYTDADGQFDIEKLKDFVDAIKRYDLIVGYRIQRQDIWLRKLYSFVYNKLIQLLFGLRVRDIDCSFKLFRRDCLRKLSIERDNFFVDTELLLKAKNNNCRFREIGIKHRPRRKGKSTVKFKHIFVTLGDILYFYPRRKYGRS